MDCMNKYVDLFHELQRIIDMYRNVPFVEIEIRLGWKHASNGFDANIGKTHFDWIRDKLDSSSFLRCTGRDMVSNVYSHQGTLSRIITDDKHIILDRHVKRKLETVDLYAPGTPFDIRISVCIETPFSKKSRGSQNQIDITDCTYVRKRVRTTYEYKMWRYDTTICVADKPSNLFVLDKDTFEFELELDVVAANRECTASTYLAHSAIMKICDILTINAQEEIHLKSTDVCDRRRFKNNNKQSKLQS
jgi:hypothetical protein